MLLNIHSSFLFVAEQDSPMLMYCPVFIPSSLAGGRLRCFLFRDILTKAVMTFMYKSLEESMRSLLLCKYLGVKQLRHMVGVCVTF